MNSPHYLLGYNFGALGSVGWLNKASYREKKKENERDFSGS
jgi:hypothetical protein